MMSLNGRALLMGFGGILLTCSRCISSGKLVDREMSKVGYRRATRAELMSPLLPSFPVRPMPAEIAVQPRERLVGRWSGAYAREIATHLLSSGYKGTPRVKWTHETFAFMDDGTCSGQSDAYGVSASWSGTWNYTQEGVLSISGKYADGRLYAKFNRLVWFNENQFWLRAVDVNRHADVLRKSGRFKSVTSHLDASGVLHTQKVLETKGRESVIVDALGPQICDRVGNAPPMKASAVPELPKNAGMAMGAPKACVFERTEEGLPAATIPVSGKEMEGEWEVVQSVRSLTLATGMTKSMEYNQVTRNEYAFYDDGTYRLTTWIKGKESGRNGDWCCTNGLLRLSVDNQKGGKLVMDLKCVKKSEEGLEFRYDDMRAFENMFLVGNVTSMKALYNEKGELVTHMVIDSEGKNGIKSHIEMDSTYSPMIFERK